MADDGEEKLFEKQLEIQLEEQKESLTAVEEALVVDPGNDELLWVHKELLDAISDAEEQLLHIKRSRLLRETDSILLRQSLDSVSKNVQLERLASNQIQAETLEVKGFTVGSKCRFRHTDGRWYNGHIIRINGDTSVRISFLTPTSESMMICKFFQQQRCRFGSSCRLSHGVDVSVSLLKPYVPTAWQQSMVGSSLLAVSDQHGRLWRDAELESWDDELGIGQVVFRDDGSSAKLNSDFLSLSEYAQISDEEDDESSSEGSESSYEDEDIENGNSNNGLGFLEATTSLSGIQTETAVFAEWEHHTRGIASKMMASMGYRHGMGLGISGQGIVDPLSVKVLPPKQSLDHAVKSLGREEGIDGTRRKKRSRGGKRKREKKFAAAARAAKAEERNHPDVFNFINNQLAMQSDAEKAPGKKLRETSGEGKHDKKEDRRSLVAYDEEVKDLRNKIEKLEEMVKRNQKEKAVYEAFTRKLEETRRALADAEAAQASASNAVVRKEKEKKWLKF